MKTALVEGYDIPVFDKTIMTNLLVSVVDLNIVRQEFKLIGVRNAKQEIYRVIGASTDHQYQNAFEELDDMGLVDDLQESDREKNGYDAIFSLGLDAD
ncbi:hypothetical protein ACVBEF_16150 [Glaciimonas sp. GG7]